MVKLIFNVHSGKKKYLPGDIKAHTDKKKQTVYISYHKVVTEAFNYVVTTDQLARMQENRITVMRKS